MFKNLKPDRLKIVKFHKKSLPELVRLVFRKLKSARVRLFMILAVFSIVPLYFVDVMIPYYYRSSMIKDRKADLQTKAAVVAGEYADFESLAEAEKAGMYNQMGATPHLKPCVSVLLIRILSYSRILILLKQERRLLIHVSSAHVIPKRVFQDMIKQPEQ